MDANASPVILVIDDDPAICQALKLHLQFRGYVVETVQKARSGLARLADGGVDLVLTDIGLPDMTGHEVVQRGRRMAGAAGEQPPEFVVMTGNATLDHAIASLQEGAFQFVTKPLSMPFLEVVVDRALALRTMNAQIDAQEREHERLLLETLADVTGQIGLVGTLESVLRALVALARPREAAIWLASEEDDTLQPVTVRETSGPAGLEPGHKALAERCHAAGETLLEVAGDDRWCAAPILIDGQREGAVSAVLGPDAEPLDDAGLTGLIADMATFAGNAVRRERLFATLEQSSMQISSLFEVGLAMSQEVSLQRLFDVIVDSAARICGAERCSLMLVDRGGEVLRIRAARGIPEEIVAKAEARVGEGIAGTVAATGEALFISNIEENGQFCRKNNTATYRNNSLVCVPVRVHNQVVGVLNVNNKRNGADFTPNDLTLLTLLASQAAVAIDNAHRYQDLSEKAITDGLTGVYIRRYFDECLDRAYKLGRQAGQRFSLLMADIDHFKAVNDTHGHQIGDEALKAVAGILKDAVRDDDLVARYGGEEFAIILARAESQTAREVAERIRRQVETSEIELSDGLLRITMSLGVATWSEAVESPEQLLKSADEALYRAKQTGRNRVVVAGDA